MTTYKSPGVYREEIFLKPAPALRTGVVGLVGFADELSDAQTPFNTPVALHRKEDFAARFIARPESFLGDAITGFFDNGGLRCYVVHADPSGHKETALQSAISSLALIDDLDLVAVPDAMSLDDAEAIRRVQRAAIQHCAEQGNRFALLDAMRASATEAVLEQGERLVRGQSEPISAALYYPWLLTIGGRAVPPCGHVAGIFARTDAKVGVFKAPANEEIFGALDLERQIDNTAQDQLNPEGVNCLRVFPGRGIRVWGARTLSRDSNWRYVNVRRLFLTLRRWIDANMMWAAFEPNTVLLWARIQRELTTYLSKLFRDGALRGATEAEAFYVKCDAETNPPERRDAGEVATEIGLAPMSPAEFIVVRIIHRVGRTDSG
ncbi:MAG: phage tail sheath subtilisin-like domain-containing protein [Acidobacteriota bacterium]